MGARRGGTRKEFEGTDLVIGAKILRVNLQNDVQRDELGRAPCRVDFDLGEGKFDSKEGVKKS